MATSEYYLSEIHRVSIITYHITSLFLGENWSYLIIIRFNNIDFYDMYIDKR
jgi:hypothetical protein